MRMNRQPEVAPQPVALERAGTLAVAKGRLDLAWLRPPEKRVETRRWKKKKGLLTVLGELCNGGTGSTSEGRQAPQRIHDTVPETCATHCAVTTSLTLSTSHHHHFHNLDCHGPI
jgi:hypothetical protein